jgi:SAM-dependent methyltransferase
MFPVLIFAHSRPECLEKLLLGSRRNFECREVWLFLDGPINRHQVALQERMKKVFGELSPKNAPNVLEAKNNLQPRFAIPEGLRQFFRCHEVGIFLEEDLLIGDIFFDFADSSLSKMHGDETLSGFTGFRPPEGPSLSSSDVSPYRAAVSWPWGWGTSRRLWSLYRDDALNRSFADLARASAGFSESQWINCFWLANLILTAQGKNSSWFFRWQYTCIKHGLHSLLPSVNLVANSGFGGRATHTAYIKDVTSGSYVREGRLLTSNSGVCKRIATASYYRRAWHVTPYRWFRCVISVFVPTRSFYWVRRLRTIAPFSRKRTSSPVRFNLPVTELNREQAAFYDAIHLAEGAGGYAENKRANLLTRSWAALRYRQQAAVAQAGIDGVMKEAHQRWIKAKVGGAFLEVGCFSGSPSTFELARAAAIYRGIELSPLAVARLNERFAEEGLQARACAEPGDFLLMDENQQYDLIYAHGVLHHFENPQPVFEKLARLLKLDGRLIFVDPCAVNPVYRALRMAYRPFQSDAAWEWPFRPVTVTALERYFEIVEGFGWGRRSLPLSVLTGLPVIGRFITPRYVRLAKGEVAAGWHDKVWMNSMVTACYRPRGGEKATR